MSSRYKLKITEVNAGGMGIGIIEDAPIEVPFTLENETVEVDIRHKTKRQKRAFPRALITSHPDRVLPACPHFTQCGGCLLQHFSAEMYQDFKYNKVIEALSEQMITAPVETPIILGPGLRRRIDFQARLWDGEVCMGYHEAESKKPFNVAVCPLVTRDIEALFVPLRALVEPMLETERLIHFFITQADNGLDVLLAGFKNSLSSCQEEALMKFAQEHPVIRLAYKVKRCEKIVYMTQTPIIRFGDHDVPISAFGFLQATKESDQIFARFLKEAFSGEYLTIADLFCGRGTLSLALTKMGHCIHGYECDKHALQALNTIAEPALTVHERNLFERPLKIAEIDQFDAIVMNPPRAGAQEQAKALAESAVKRLVYISCNPETFARDCHILMKGGFVLKRVLPLDQFMWSPHIEVLGLLERQG